MAGNKQTKTQTAKDIGLAALNYLSHLGYWNKIYQNTSLNKLSPEENAMLVSQYVASLGFTDKLPGKESFDEYIKTRIKNADDFSKIMLPDGKSSLIAELNKLAASNLPTDPAQTASANSMLGGITKALNPDKTALNLAQEKFNKGMKKIDDAIKNADSVFRPSHMLTLIHELKSDACKAIKEQHALEKKNLEETLTNYSIPDPLKGRLGITSEEQEKRIKDDMLDTLSKSQAKQLTDFEKGMDEKVLTKMHQAAEIENRRVSFLAGLYNDSEMKKMINALHAKNQRPGTAAVQVGEDGALFKGMKVSDLDHIVTLTGRKINITKTGKDKKGNDIADFSMEFPHHYFRPDYWHSSHNKPKLDMMSIAGAVRASGFDSITMTIDNKNGENAMELARVAYEACLETGFPAKGISLVVNGKKMSANEVFATCPSRLTAAHAKASQNEETEKEINEKVNKGQEIERFKTDLNAGRLANKAAIAEAQNERDELNGPPSIPVN